MSETEQAGNVSRETLMNRIANATDLEKNILSDLADIKSIASDSLDYLLFIQKIEAEFKVEIPNEKLADFVTVGDVASWLEAYA